MPHDHRLCLWCQSMHNVAHPNGDNPRFCSELCAACYAYRETAGLVWSEEDVDWHRPRPDPPCYIV